SGGSPPFRTTESACDGRSRATRCPQAAARKRGSLRKRNETRKSGKFEIKGSKSDGGCAARRDASCGINPFYCGAFCLPEAHPIWPQRSIVTTLTTIQGTGEGKQAQRHERRSANNCHWLSSAGC